MSNNELSSPDFNIPEKRSDEPMGETPDVRHVPIDQAPVSEQEIHVRSEVPEEEFNAALGGAASLLGGYDEAKAAGNLDKAEQSPTHNPPTLAEYGEQLDAQEELEAEQGTDNADTTPAAHDETPEWAIEIAPANLKPIDEAQIPNMVNIPSDRLWDDFHAANGTAESGNSQA